MQSGIGRITLLPPVLHEIREAALWNDADEVVDEAKNEELIARKDRFEHVGVYPAIFTGVYL